jgi:uncharacterized DUF497 family protein
MNRFEWDPRKAATNLRKHRVSFEEAATVFGDPLASVYEDPDHSTAERRFLAVGTSANGRLIHVAFADRGPSHGAKENFMKKKNDEDADEMRPEYDLSKLKFVGRGIYAKRYRSGTNIVLLDNDVRKAFPDDESVNEALRLIAKVAKRQASRAKKPQSRKTAPRSRRAA